MFTGKPPLSARATIHLTVVDNMTPRFNENYYYTEVPEDVPVGHTVLSMDAISPSGNKLTYAILDGDTYSEFDVDFDIGGYFE